MSLSQILESAARAGDPGKAMTLQEALVELSKAREAAARARGACQKATQAEFDARRAKDQARMEEERLSKLEQDAYARVNRLVKEATQPDGVDPASKKQFNQDVIL